MQAEKYLHEVVRHYYIIVYLTLPSCLPKIPSNRYQVRVVWQTHAGWRGGHNICRPGNIRQYSVSILLQCKLQISCPSRGLACLGCSATPHLKFKSHCDLGIRRNDMLHSSSYTLQGFLSLAAATQVLPIPPLPTVVGVVGWAWVWA